jgi:putative ABC transport system permease protein
MMLSALAHDCRTAARRLWRTPWHSAVLILTLALGVGAHAAVYSVASAVLYPDNPFDEGHRVVYVELHKRGMYAPLLERHAAALATQSQWFERVETVRLAQTLWRRGDSSKRLPAGFVTPTLLPGMGVDPFLGRGFLPGEGGPAGELVVIISRRMWQHELGAGTNVIGTALLLGDERRTIVGVADPTAAYPRVDAWFPTPLDPDGTERVMAVAWLRAGVDVDRAGAEFRGAWTGLEGLDPDLDVRFVRPNQRSGASFERVLALLWIASGFVLAIICANFATLLVARNLSRQRELATCAALGASRVRIVRPLIIECLLLGVGGGLFGILVTAWGVQTLLSLRPRSLSVVYPDAIALDARVLAYTLLIASVMGVAIGILSAARWARTEILRGAGRDESYVSTRHGSRRIFGGAVVVQTALAVMLAIAAALMLTSFLRLRSLDPGFEPSNVAELVFQLDPARYPDAGVRRGFFEDVAARVSRLPGVTEATIASDAPAHSVVMSAELEVDGRHIGDFPPVEASWVHVAPNYFRVLRIPLVEGRAFAGSESTGTVILSQSIARRYWAEGKAVGRRFRLHRATGPTGWYTVVGIAGDVSGRGLRDQYDEIYLPYAVYRAEGGTILARTQADPSDMLHSMRAQLWSVDPDVPDSEAGTLAASVARSIDEQPFYSALFSFFAVVAVLLAMLGVFGVSAHASARRRFEVAVRLALGARRSDIHRLVIRQGLLPSALGTGIGVAGALALSGVMRHLIHEVSATDPLTYLAIAVGFGMLSVLATWMPARRAARVDPASLLRA